MGASKRRDWTAVANVWATFVRIHQMETLYTGEIRYSDNSDSSLLGCSGKRNMGDIFGTPGTRAVAGNLLAQWERRHANALMMSRRHWPRTWKNKT